MMVDELCSGYESHTTASASASAAAVNGDSPELVVVSSSPPVTMIIRRSQSLPTSTTTADTILSTSQSTDRGEERFVVPHAKSEEQYVDRFGFITEHKEGQQRNSSSRSNNNEANNKNNNNNTKKEQKLAEKETNREACRVQKWTVMLDHWPALSVHRRKLIRRRLRKGLPDASMRQRVWPILLQLNERQPLAPPPPRENGHAAADNGNSNNNSNNPMSYGRLWRNNDNLQVQDIIERDIHRTFPKHSMFTSRSTDEATGNGHGQPVVAALDDEHDGQASLRRVLRAYSAYDTEIGYCQGMNFIAAVRTARCLK
jgi:Rab-GTPase-TBC domain